MKKQTRENKAIDLSVLPPCFTSLYFQMNRANFVAGMWKKTGSAQISLPHIDEHGWQVDGSIDWMTEPYPNGMYNLLLEQDDIKADSEESDFYESDIESDEDFP